MKMLLLSLITLVAFGAQAESDLIDSALLTGCGGKVELRKADNGDLALKFTNTQYSRFNNQKCDYLRFIDASSGRLIKEYEVKGTSYTLSQKMRDSLSDDCRLKVQFDNGFFTTQKLEVVLWWCSSSVSYPKNNYSYELSKNNNCKLMVNGVYQQKNVSDAFCAPIAGDKSATVAYEFSRAGRCKIMINGQFTQQFASPEYCTVNH